VLGGAAEVDAESFVNLPPRAHFHILMAPGHDAAQIESSYLPALMKAPVLALITQRPFRSEPLLP